MYEAEITIIGYRVIYKTTSGSTIRSHLIKESDDAERYKKFLIREYKDISKAWVKTISDEEKLSGGYDYCSN